MLFLTKAQKLLTVYASCDRVLDERALRNGMETVSQPSCLGVYPWYSYPDLMAQIPLNMKMIKLLFTVIGCFLMMASASFAAVIMDDTTVFDTPITLMERSEMLRKLGRANVQNLALPFVVGRDEGVKIFSLCSSSSQYLTQSRANTMAWMAGASGISTDRTSNPAACYSIPSDGLQWFDWLTTSYKSWLGTTATTLTNENGHRVVVSCAGKYPVGNYWCRIASTSTNIGSGYFPVGLFSGTTNEIQFNLNFPGIRFGTNGVQDSFYDTTLGRWVQVGDDTIYINGEYPSRVIYDWWYRFGATVQKTLALPGDVAVVKSEFVSAVQSLTAELVMPSVSTNGIGTVTVTEALPRLMASRSPMAGIRFQISGGQMGIPYELLQTTNLSWPITWTIIHSNVVWNTGNVWDDPTPLPDAYFRLRGVNPQP